MLIIFCFTNVFLNINGYANSKIDEIMIEPENPTPLSKVNFTVKMKNNTEYWEIRLILQECAEDLCFFPLLNQSMVLFDNNTYFCEVNLSIDKATQIKYSINCLENGNWTSTETYYVNLFDTYDEKQIENNPSQSTPGFELVLMLFSIGFYLVLKKRNL